MAIIYKTDHDARSSLLSGISQLAKLVTLTLGPKGRNIALDRLWSDPAIVHDGVSVAQEIEFKDPFENMGAMLVKEAAKKTNDKAGDGTTTATLLAYKLIEKGFRYLEEGANPMLMKEGMLLAMQTISTALLHQAKVIKDSPTDIENVATISAANRDMGKLIAQAVAKVGEDGVIDVVEGMGQETTIEYKEGMMFDKGYGSPMFVTNTKDMSAEVNNPMILFSDFSIDSIQDFAEFLDHVLEENDKDIVIIADNFGTTGTLSVLIDNHKRGNIHCIPIQAPSFGIKRIWLLEDMAILCGGTVISRQSGRTMASITKGELGRADKVWSDANATKIIGGRGTKEQVSERITALKLQIEKEPSEWEKKHLRERIAKLSNGAAVIQVGALTETELKDKKERLIDAVEATRSALAEGIVAGGGIALLELQSGLDTIFTFDQSLDKDILIGIKLVFSVLDEPVRKILSNAGETPEVILDKFTGVNYGYDVIKREYGDMLEMGIIDPVRVTRQALENAVSVASMILTTEGLISRHPDDKKAPLEQVLS